MKTIVSLSSYKYITYAMTQKEVDARRKSPGQKNPYVGMNSIVDTNKPKISKLAIENAMRSKWAEYVAVVVYDANDKEVDFRMLPAKSESADFPEMTEERAVNSAISRFDALFSKCSRQKIERKTRTCYTGYVSIDTLTKFQDIARILTPHGYRLTSKALDIGVDVPHQVDARENTVSKEGGKTFSLCTYKFGVTDHVSVIAVI